MKKNRWIQLWKPSQAYEEDEDNDKWWYWIEKDGKVFVPSNSEAAVKGQRYTFGDGKLDEKSLYTVSKKKINSKDYFFNERGEMLTRFIEVTSSNASSDLKNGMYYFGSDGAMKTGSQTIRDDNNDIYKFYFGTKDTSTEKKGVGITGNKSNKLYYKGLLITANDYRYQLATIPAIDGGGKDRSFIVNQNGAIQHSKVEYKEDGDILISAKTRTMKDDKEDYKVNFSDGKDSVLWKYEVSVEIDGKAADIDDLKNNVDNVKIHEVMPETPAPETK